MKNCLITKLKATVDNSSLRKLNCIILNTHKIEGMSVGYETSCLNLRTTNEPVTINIIGDGYLGVKLDTLVDKSIVIPQNTSKSIFFTNDSYRIEISGQYSLEKFHFHSPSNNISWEGFFEVDLDSLEYTPLKVFGIGGRKVTGDITKVARISPSLTELRIRVTNLTKDINTLVSKVTNNVDLYGSRNISLNISSLSPTVTEFNCFRAENVSGDIATIGRLKSITKCDMSYSKVSGSFESMVEAMCSGENARTAGVFDCICSENTTLNNKLNSSAKIEFNSTGAVLKNRTDDNIVATYNNGIWTYK